ncbi:MAG TPA: DUF2306 domain-containing protein [Pseudonocardiaceae bacterium]|nr:DUF2306 domain-containing protein [Pseudonocardiaceae bacterium]
MLVIVILQSAPPFLTFDPATESIAPLNPRVPALNYFLLVTHVLTGTIAIVTVCLAVWPWLRIRHMAVHRWIGRAYVFSALPASLCTLAINYLRSGWFANVGAYVEGGVWFLTTLIGYIAMRQRNEARHRRWMLYSFAMCAAVFWGWFLDMVITPNQTNLPYLMELIRWVGWLTNLLVVKWWLDRTERRVDRYATR